MSRNLLIVERLTIALKAAGRFDLMSDEEIDRMVDAALPDVPPDLRVRALKIVTDAFWENARECALGYLAAWKPTGRAN